MAAKYFYFYKNEGANAVSKMRGIVPKEGSASEFLTDRQRQNLVRPKPCPMWSLINDASAKFCSNEEDGMVTSFDKYGVVKEGLQEVEQTKKRLEELHARQKMLKLNTTTRHQQ